MTFQPASEGARAAAGGEPLSACPYRPGSLEWRAWNRAWTDTEADRRAEAGTYGATDADKTAAGLPARPSVPGGLCRTCNRR